MFLARWASGMRMVAAPLAGVHAMSWRTFALWNVAGGMLWPASIAAVAYVLGRRVAVLIGVATLLAIVAVITSRRRRARRAPGP